MRSATIARRALDAILPSSRQALPGYKSLPNPSLLVAPAFILNTTRLSVQRSSFHPIATTPSFRRAFSTSPTVNMPSKSQAFFDLVKNRRTIYALNDKAPISDDEIYAIAKETVLHVPSSFNSQSARIVILLKEEHKKFWGFVREALKPLAPPETFPKTEEKLNGFKAGYGTILFFEDSKDVEGLQNAFALYSSYFPQWSEHTSAMHQFVLWTALEAEGFGANLQHYNPVVDDQVRAEWKVPESWQLKAQLVFGGKAADAGEKTFKPIEDRLIVHGK